MDVAVHIRFRDGLFAVDVDPVDDVYPPRTFATHRAARGFAGGIRMCRGWKVVDHTNSLPSPA